MVNQITWKTNSSFLLNSNIPPKSFWKRHQDWINKKHQEAWDNEELTHQVDVIIRFRKKKKVS